MTFIQNPASFMITSVTSITQHKLFVRLLLVRLLQQQGSILVPQLEFFIEDDLRGFNFSFFKRSYAIFQKSFFKSARGPPRVHPSHEPTRLHPYTTKNPSSSVRSFSSPLKSTQPLPFSSAIFFFHP